MSEIIVNKSETRSYEQLSEQEKKQVETKSSLLDYMNQIFIIQFGLDSSKEVTTILTEIVLRLRGREFEEIEPLITNFLGDLKTIDLTELLKTNKKRTSTRFPGSKKKEEENVTKLLIKQLLVQNKIDEIEDKLLDTQISLTEDMCFCAKMIPKMFEYAKDQEIDYITIQKTIERIEAEKRQLEELYRQYPDNSEYLYRISEIERAIEKLNAKGQEIISFRQSILGSVSNISLVQRGEEIMVLRIKDAINNVISLWKRSFGFALEVYRKEKEVIINRIIEEETNQLLRQNGERLKMTSLSKEQPIDVKMLQEVNKKLEKALGELNEVSKEVEKVKQDTIKVVSDIQAGALELQTATNIKQLEDNNE